MKCELGSDFHKLAENLHKSALLRTLSIRCKNNFAHIIVFQRPTHSKKVYMKMHKIDVQKNTTLKVELSFEAHFQKKLINRLYI